MTKEKTLIIIKPSLPQPNSIGEIIDQLEKKNWQIVGLKMMQLTSRTAEIFYQEHQNKLFFRELVEFISSSPVVIICLTGNNVVQLSRELIGSTDPKVAQEGTLRKKYGTSIQTNAIHGSDSPQAAAREIKIFFSTQELY